MRRLKPGAGGSSAPDEHARLTRRIGNCCRAAKAAAYTGFLLAPISDEDDAHNSVRRS